MCAVVSLNKVELKFHLKAITIYVALFMYQMYRGKPGCFIMVHNRGKGTSKCEINICWLTDFVSQFDHLDFQNNYVALLIPRVLKYYKF